MRKPDEKKPHPGAMQITDDHGSYWVWMELLRLDDVNVCPNSQRKLHESRVERIKSEFDARAALLIASYRPDGTYWRIGGQHCSHVIRDRGERSWPFIVFSFDTEREETVTIEHLNRYKAQTQTDTIRQRIWRDDEETLRHLAVIKSAGRDFKADHLSWRDLNTFETTKRIEALVGSRGLKAELEFANDTWPRQEEVRESSVLWGVHFLISECRSTRNTFPSKTVCETLAGVTLQSIKSRAQNYKGYAGRGDRKQNGRIVAQAMCDFYNERRESGTARLVPKWSDK